MSGLRAGWRTLRAPHRCRGCAIRLRKPLRHGFYLATARCPRDARYCMRCGLSRVIARGA